MKKTLIVTTDILAALCLYFAVVSLAVVIALGCRPLYYFDMKALNISYDSGLSEAEIKENYDAMIDYFRLDNNGKFSLPTLEVSESGAIHFADTRAIFRVFQYGLIAAGICAGALIILKRQQKRPAFLKYASVGLAATVGIVALGGLLDWEDVFIVFHKLFFTNDFWLFDAATDPVITILPDTYFMHCALLIAAVMLAGCVVSFLVYKKKKRLVG